MTPLVSEDAAVREWWAFAHRIAQEFYFPGSDWDDVNQEALIGLLIGIRSFESGHGIPCRNWYGLTIRRRLLTRLKLAQRLKHRPLNESVRSFVDEDGERLPIVDALPGGVDPHAVAVAREELAALVERSRTLSPLERRSIMGIANGLSYCQIEGTPEGSKPKWVDNAVQRARKKLAA